MSKHTQEEIQRYATSIGIGDLQTDPIDKHLKPIAEHGLNSELPEEWQVHYHESEENPEEQVAFFHNSSSGESQYEHPAEGFYRNVALQKRTQILKYLTLLFFSSSSSSSSSSKQKKPNDLSLVDKQKIQLAAEMTFSTMPQGYQEHCDDETHETFFSCEGKESTSWDHPLLSHFQEKAQKLLRSSSSSSSSSSSAPRSLSSQDNNNNTNSKSTNNVNATGAATAAAGGGGEGTNSDLRQDDDMVVSHQQQQQQSSLLSPSPSKEKATSLRTAGGTDAIRIEWHPILGVGFRKDEKFENTTSDKFDPVFGAPFMQGYPEKQSHGHAKPEYDDFFGAPVRKGKFQKPTGKPKRAGDIKDPNAALKQQEQQRMMMMQQQQQLLNQQQQQAPVAAGAAGMGVATTQNSEPTSSSASISPSPSSASTTQQQQQQNQHQQNLQQSQLQHPQILFLAKQLGIDSEKEKYLLPIALEAMTMPLPDGWVRQQDPKTGMIFYGNTNTKAVAWSHPCFEMLQAKLKAAREKGPGQQVSSSSTSSASPSSATTTSAAAASSSNQQQQQQQQHHHHQPQPEKQKKQKIEQHVREYAEYVGVDLEQEPYLLSVIIEGASAEMPEGFTAHQTEEGETFYVNEETQESQWESPLAEHDEKIKQEIELTRASHHH